MDYRMDIFVEQLIRKRTGLKDYLIYAGIMLAVVVVIFLFLIIPFLAPFLLLAAVGVCVGAYYLISSRNVEFEYSVTNGDVTVDKIISRRKRKRLVSFDSHKVEDFGLYKPEAHAGKPYEKRVFASKTDDGRAQGTWFAAVRTPKTGYTLVVFNPDERVLDAMKPFLPRQLSKSVFGRN